LRLTLSARTAPTRFLDRINPDFAGKADIAVSKRISQVQMDQGLPLVCIATRSLPRSTLR
jgi:hypothetical protein